MRVRGIVAAADVVARDVELESLRPIEERVDRRVHLVEVVIVVRHGGDVGHSSLRGAAQYPQRIFDVFRTVADAEGQMAVQIDHAFPPSFEVRSAAQKLNAPSGL